MIDQIEWLPPVPDPEKIVCIGLNYRSHTLETGREAPAKPVVFTRFANSQIGHGQPIVRPSESKNLDYEAEIAVIIGKRGRRISQKGRWSISPATAATTTARCATGSATPSVDRRARTSRSTGGFGPWMVTADEIPADAQDDAVTPPQRRAHAARHHRADDLQDPEDHRVLLDLDHAAAGDVIVTGTPGGVGARRKPPLWMKPGDKVEIEIDNPLRYRA